MKLGFYDFKKKLELPKRLPRTSQIALSLLLHRARLAEHFSNGQLGLSRRAEQATCAFSKWGLLFQHLFGSSRGLLRGTIGQVGWLVAGWLAGSAGWRSFAVYQGAPSQSLGGPPVKTVGPGRQQPPEEKSPSKILTESQQNPIKFRITS